MSKQNSSQFFLPDLGEGLQEAEIIEWHVKVGDFVEVDQVVVEVETAKAIVEIPSPVKAQIMSLEIEAGETLDVGGVLFRYADGTTVATENVKEDELVASAERESVSVVGNLAEAEKGTTNAYEGAATAVTEAKPEKFYTQTNRRDSDKRAHATPAIKAFARKLGLEGRLSEHQYGELKEQDLLDMYQRLQKNDASISDGPREHILKLTGARKVMAQSMTKSHQHIPSVTLFDDADISHWEKGSDITLRVIEALVAACNEVPLLNAWFDEENLCVQMFDDINLGVAVNAKDGLFVPVIRQIQNLEPDRIRDILDKQIKQVEDRTIKPQKLMGATISISNFGTLSGRYATPIIVPPQVAIVGIGKIRQEPVVREGALAIGTVMPISLSFDHRAASGADAAAFMSAMIDVLSIG